MAGILADTNFFQYSNTTVRAMKIAADLVDKGGDRDLIEFNILRQIELSAVRLIGVAATNFNVDLENKFGWFVVPYEVYREIVCVFSKASSWENII